jgi:hypothetical protein
VKNHPHINEGKGATLVPGTMHMHYNDLCIALSDYLCSMSITVRHRHAFSRSHACLCSCTIQCPALYVFTRVRACCHAPHSVLLCMFSHACLFSCTTQCPALYVFMRVLVLMHHTVSCSVCFYARACVHAHHTVSCSVVNAHPAQWGSLGGTLVHWGFIIMFLDRHSNWGSLIIIHIGVS